MRLVQLLVFEEMSAAFARSRLDILRTNITALPSRSQVFITKMKTATDRTDVLRKCSGGMVIRVLN